MLSRTVATTFLLALGLAAANAGYIYGLNTGADQGIYRINTATGAAKRVYSLSNAGSLGNSDSNGFAYDHTSGSFYYKGNGGKLYRRNASGETALGTLAKNATSATFYQGKYWYVEDGSNRLRAVNVGTFSDTLVGTMAGLKNSGYGDIASQEDGAFVGASANGFYREGDLDTPLSKVSYAAKSPGNLQLGFYMDRDLYGIATSTDQIVSVDVATGKTTTSATLQNTNLFITDAASEAVPEPATLAILGLGAIALLRRKRA